MRVLRFKCDEKFIGDMFKSDKKVSQSDFEVCLYFCILNFPARNHSFKLLKFEEEA